MRFSLGPDPRSGPLTSWTWTYNLGPGPPVSGPGPRHLGSGLVWTWVCQVQDQTSDSLDGYFFFKFIKHD